MSAIVVRSRKRKVGLLVPAKFMAVAKDRWLQLFFRKFEVFTVKFVVFMLDSNKYPCMVIVGSDKFSLLFKRGSYSDRGVYS